MQGSLTDRDATVAWPPPGLALAACACVERADDDETLFERWTAGWWLSLQRRGPWRAGEARRFAGAVQRHAATLAATDDVGLRQAARAAARAALGSADAADGARALAHVREVAHRTLGLLAHPPQVLAAWKLVCGRLVELDTGEGKTLTAGLAACLAALAGVSTHVVTVNDYLAQRDAQTLAPLFDWFGLRVGVVHGGVAPGERAAAYACDITYCTNKDLVFDYLRDRVGASGARSLVQWQVRRLHGTPAVTGFAEALRLPGLHLAIVDEADSILIDEARTPLILSATRAPAGHEAAYRQLLKVAAALRAPLHYRLVGPHRGVELTDTGRRHIEAMAEGIDGNGGDGGEGVDVWRMAWAREHYVGQALRALQVLQRDHHYVVREGKVVIVDEFTGRLLHDRNWEQGLHQLVETKEGCALTGQSQTLARLTYQGFFARYLRLSGMSGTLREVARETAAVYRVRTERIAPNRPCRRIELPTLLLASRAAQRAAVVAEVVACLLRGQPVLVGTRSVHASQALGDALHAAGVPHRVLNALQNADEARLVATAGLPGAVTVATNMAGRGTDIALDPTVLALGGLHVVLTEWHESARIDRQLFGRCARQGDPGSCRAIVSLDDEVIQQYASGTARWLTRRWPDNPPAWAVRWLRRAVQRAAERGNAAQRRATMAHDRHMRRQLAFSGSSE